AASAAVRREEDEGSPLRVWVESEIADSQSVAGELLRKVAREGVTPAAELRRIAEARIHQQLAAAGIDRLLGEDECRRRAEEAAGGQVRMLGEAGPPESEGDPTDPDASPFPESLVRRILAGAPRATPPA